MNSGGLIPNRCRVVRNSWPPRLTHCCPQGFIVLAIKRCVWCCCSTLWTVRDSFWISYSLWIIYTNDMINEDDMTIWKIGCDNCTLGNDGEVIEYRLELNVSSRLFLYMADSKTNQIERSPTVWTHAEYISILPTCCSHFLFFRNKKWHHHKKSRK